MQTIHVNVEESQMDTFLHMLKNLKEDVVKSYSISSTEDAFYDERKQRLTTLREEIHSKKEPLAEFNASIDSLLEELQS
jgi:hypothetical protein